MTGNLAARREFRDATVDDVWPTFSGAQTVRHGEPLAGCWADRAGTSTPCGRAPSSDLGLCATHLELLRKGR